MVVLVLILAATYFPGSRAYPDYWASDSGRGEQQCDAHPTEALRGSPHGSPLPDSSVTIRALQADGTDAMQLCPGMSYKVLVTFPERRRSIITASSGSFDDTTYLWGSRCPNLIVVGPTLPVTSFAKLPTEVHARLNIPCNGSAGAAANRAAVEQLVVAVTSTSARGSLRWRSTSKSFPMSPSCGNAQCG
ncbi:hypothetical protein VOLCADRAFT_94466 [Volvox carteri f. nagariensis]|uniref:Pherophorin domain-containing protein n=1 Tax=Volvox carteri f. nagariensis TaxID=3068 RepID=D8U4V8_VOLCA|nr:uncharacterized protein VOLCADRAFT_94466 [Volvox carteri f. nagariensis]EFJ45257.1 hypothetical protein VOLCADRAFT_94466 [Volvox carteri f. nagariensis]|eukprot:XP_002953633.1 hypothetical protein VOLCADRAFT_94466 [Volvox carteri f. nagariensis]